jgi:hypothetical protein
MFDSHSSLVLIQKKALIGALNTIYSEYGRHSAASAWQLHSHLTGIVLRRGSKKHAHAPYPVPQTPTAEAVVAAGEGWLVEVRLPALGALSHWLVLIQVCFSCK